MRVAILAITEAAQQLATKLLHELPEAESVRVDNGIKNGMKDAWNHYDGIVCIMAAGIVVRSIAGLCYKKTSDPAVVVVDEKGQFAVSLLSGHIGGANKLAEKIAEICDGAAVVTTGSDVSGHTSLDIWALENNLSICNDELLSRYASQLLNRGSLSIYDEVDFIDSLPPDIVRSETKSAADILVTSVHDDSSDKLQLMPRVYYIGVGCRRGVEAAEIEEALENLLQLSHIDARSVAGLASIDLKKDEEGLLKAAATRNWPIQFFSKEEINNTGLENRSQKVFEKIGTFGVCEPTAILAATKEKKVGRLITGKITWEKVTAAIAAVDV